MQLSKKANEQKSKSDLRLTLNDQAKSSVFPEPKEEELRLLKIIYDQSEMINRLIEIKQPHIKKREPKYYLTPGSKRVSENISDQSSSVLLLKQTNTANIPQINVKLSFKKKVAPVDLVIIKSSYDAYIVLLKIFRKDTFQFTEELILLCLNRANKVIGSYKIASGGITGLVADPRVMFCIALQYSACSIMIAHNHPSGNLKPSNADIELTNNIKRIGELLQIRVLDHLIISAEGYYSFSDEECL